MKRTSLAVLFLAGVAAALDVNPNDILAQVSASLDAKYTPFETAGQTIATWVSDTPGPVVTPDKDAAGMTPGVSKGVSMPTLATLEPPGVRIPVAHVSTCPHAGPRQCAVGELQ